MTNDLNHYNSPPLKHTVKEINELAGGKNKTISVV